MLTRFGIPTPPGVQKERASLVEERRSISGVVKAAMAKGAENWTTGDELRVGLGTWRLHHIAERLKGISVWWK